MIGFLLGKPPERSPVLPDVLRTLEGQSVDVRYAVPEDPTALPSWAHEAECLALRGLSPGTLAAVARLEATGVPCCNSARATRALRDRLAVRRRLLGAVPLPHAVQARSWEEASAHAESHAVVVKARHADRGRGALVHFPDPGRTSRREPFPGPYVVEERVEREGPDRKLYVIGSDVTGLLKRWPRDGQDPEPFTPSAGLERVARRTGRLLGLAIYGVDVVFGRRGPVVVDVNAFPSCAGVDGAAERIATHLLEVARSGRR